MERCKACGRQFNSVQTMTYSAYGYCCWECLMKSRTNPRSRGRKNVRNSGRHNAAGYRSR